MKCCGWLLPQIFLHIPTILIAFHPKTFQMSLQQKSWRKKPEFKWISWLDEGLVSDDIFLGSSNGRPLFHPRLINIKEDFIGSVSGNFSTKRNVNGFRLLLFLDLANKEEFLFFGFVAKVCSRKGDFCGRPPAVFVQVWSETHCDRRWLIDNYVCKYDYLPMRKSLWGCRISPLSFGGIYVEISL